MGWSNDQLNEIEIYDPLTQELILSVDENGFRYVVGSKEYVIDATSMLGRVLPDDGSYAAIVPLTAFGTTRFELSPADHDGTPWALAGFVSCAQTEDSPGVWRPRTTVSSPAPVDDITTTAQISMYGEDTAGGESFLQMFADQLLGQKAAQISQGTLDSYTGTTFLNFTAATDAAVDALLATWFGTGMISTRIYEAAFSGTVTSSIVNDRIGLRLYKNSANNLTGATQIADFGQIRVDVASVAQPFRVDAEFTGDASNPYIILAARRASGTGTCNVTTIYRRLADLCPV